MKGFDDPAGAPPKEFWCSSKRLVAKVWRPEVDSGNLGGACGSPEISGSPEGGSSPSRNPGNDDPLDILRFVKEDLNHFASLRLIRYLGKLMSTLQISDFIPWGPSKC